MTDRLARWAKRLDKNDKFLGKIIRLCYEIAVWAPFQSAVHILASCLLGAFCYKDSQLNWMFLIPFSVIYLIFISAFTISNQHRKDRNTLIRSYEVSLPRITNAFNVECRKEKELYDSISSALISDVKNVEQFCGKLDVFSEACFRICAVVNDLLREVSGLDTFRVMTFVRTTGDNDEYHVNGYSPEQLIPESCHIVYNLGDYTGKHKKKAPVHAEPFINKRAEPVIYMNDEVQKKYLDFNEEHPTKLHIGIPCTVGDQVVAVLQITSYQNIFSSKSNAENFINNTLAIFTSYMKVVYMHQLEHDFWARYVSKLRREN